MEQGIVGIPKVFWSKSGLAVARPAATGLANGSIWNSTDTKDIDQVQAGAWATILDYSALTASVLTTRGDIIRRGAAADERLAKGAAGTVLTMGADDPAWAANPSPLTVAETEVYNAAAPTAWTDLNLSGVVGSNVALVILKVDIANGISAAFRKNGDASEYFSTDTADARGCALVKGLSPVCLVVIVPTDAAGIIEWMAAAVNNVTIDIVAYIK